jgi:hypothetical protein
MNLAEIVPPIIKKNPRPVAAEKALTLSCRRRQLFDQHGMPILIHNDSHINDAYL